MVLEKIYGPDKSSYDGALAFHLAFWTGNHCERIRKLMLQSKLVRDKWERGDPNTTDPGGRDYLPLTILTACQKQTKFLTDKKPVQHTRLFEFEKKSIPARLISKEGNTFLSYAEQVDLFQGCTYVIDANKILVPGGLLLDAERFNNIFSGYSFTLDATNTKNTKHAWEAFNQSHVNRKDDSIAVTTCFRPDVAPGQTVIGRDGRKEVNQYWPLEVTRVKGDVAPFLDHLEKLFPDESARLPLLYYMAALVQYQGVKFQWAPFIQGTPGNGKTFLSTCMRHAVGDLYSQIVDAEAILDKFNGYLYATIFIGINDIFQDNNGERVIERLKPWMTDSYVPIRIMNRDPMSKYICCNFIFTSNHKDGVKKTFDDRRFAPFFCAQQHPGDLRRDGMFGDYFPNLFNWAKASEEGGQDGYRKIAEYLYTLELPDRLNEFNPASGKPAPRTKWSEEAILESLGFVEQHIIEAVEQNKQGFKKGWISSIALDHLLDSLRMNHRIAPRKRRQLLQSLGYDWHPSLPDGRATGNIAPDQGRPKLFVVNNHPTINETDTLEIMRTYSKDQLM